MDEFMDACRVVLGPPSLLSSSVLEIKEVIRDSLSDLPVLAYVHLPTCDDRVIQNIVNRCCTIRSITEVWIYKNEKKQ
jgi:hypothetical protein